MARKFKVQTKDSPLTKFLTWLAKIFKRKPNFINLNEGAADGADLEKRCILIGNHNGAGGPFTYRTFMNKRFMTWGAHQMCEGFSSRRKYLYHTFYRQKLGWPKGKARFMSVFFGSIAGIFYRCAGIIPVYFDLRIAQTFKYSNECLAKDISVLITPEDSTEGYKEHIERLWPGFLHFAKLHYKRYGTDLPIYTLYYSKKPKTIVIGKPMFYQELLKQGYSEEEITEKFRVYMNSLSELVPKKQTLAEKAVADIPAEDIGFEAEIGPKKNAKERIK